MFSIPEIEKEMMALMQKPMSMANLHMFNELSEAMKNMGHVKREFTEDDAKQWVSHMDPQARWTMEQTTAVMNQKGYSHRPCEFWAVMNSLASDYGKTMAKFGADKPEVWAELAHDWLDDVDAEDHKVGRYWRDIVRH